MKLKKGYYMQPEKILKECNSIIKQRAKEYGSAKESFSLIAQYWMSYLNRNITIEDVSMMMVLMKIARTRTDKKKDSYVDAINYIAFGGSFALEKDKMEKELEDVMQYFEE